MNKLLLSLFLLVGYITTASAQMPPPGYERAKKMELEKAKMSPMERDSIALTDTIVIFDPNTYEQEVNVVTRNMSLKDYCMQYLGMSNPDILLDGQPHVIIDPDTYEEIRVRLTSNKQIERLPR